MTYGTSPKIGVGLNAARVNLDYSYRTYRVAAFGFMRGCCSVLWRHRQLGRIKSPLSSSYVELMREYTEHLTSRPKKERS